jgi:hypothetical protein
LHEQSEFLVLFGLMVVQEGEAAFGLVEVKTAVVDVGYRKIVAAFGC